MSARATRIALTLVFFFVLSAQRDPILVPEVSQHEVQVRQGFTGTELLLFGAILDPDGTLIQVLPEPPSSSGFYRARLLQ